MTDQEKQSILDEEHLRLLRLGYIIIGVADLFFALFPLMYVVLGIGMAASGTQIPTRPGEPSLAFLGGFHRGVLVSRLASSLRSRECCSSWRPARSVNGARGCSARLRLAFRVCKCPGECCWLSSLLRCWGETA